MHSLDKGGGGATHGGGDTTDPDATHPRAIYQNLGGGGRWGGGYWREGSQGGGGGLCATQYYRMPTSRGDVCQGIWGYGGMYAIIALVFGGKKVAADHDQQTHVGDTKQLPPSNRHE